MPKKSDNEMNGEQSYISKIESAARKKMYDFLGWKKEQGPEAPRAWRARKEQGPGFWGADIGVSEEKKKK